MEVGMKVVGLMIINMRHGNNIEPVAYDVEYLS